jgi:CP family cyanate transporter-like MFS transporter
MGVGAVLEAIRADTGLSAAAAGVLAAIPLLAFAAISPLAPAIGRRVGMERAIFIALLLLALGILIRSAPSNAALFAGSALLASAIAIGNVLVPGLIKRDFPDKVGVMTSVFAVSMALSAALATGIVVPLAAVLPGGWRGSLGIWLLPALVTALFLLPRLKSATPPPPQASGAKARSVWRSKLAWNVTAYMGLQSMSFYVLIGWLPTILQSQGMSATAAGWLLSVLTALGVMVGFVLPPLMARFDDQRWLAAGFGLITLIGYSGMALMPQYTAASALVVGFGVGGCFLLALAFFSLRASNAEEAAALSGMAQSVGYGIAALGPILFGLLHDLTASWTLPVWMLVAVALAQTITGYAAGRKAHVGDDAVTRSS